MSMYDSLNRARKNLAENLTVEDKVTIEIDGENYVNAKAISALISAVGLTGVILGMTESDTRSYSALMAMGHNLKAMTDLANGYYTLDNYRVEDNPPMPGAEVIKAMEEGFEAKEKEDELLKRLEGELDN